MSQPRMEADSTRAFFRVTWTSAVVVVSLTLVGGNRTGSRPSRRRWYAIGAWLHPARNKASTNCATRFIRMFDFAKAVMRCELTVRCPDERGRLPVKDSLLDLIWTPAMRIGRIESNLMFCRRAKKFACDGRDYVARNQALKVRTEIVAAAGDDVTLSCGQSVQANTSDFFGGFARTFRSWRRIVACHHVELGFR